MSTQYRLVQSGKTASGGCSAGQGSSEPVAPRIYLFYLLMIRDERAFTVILTGKNPAAGNIVPKIHQVCLFVTKFLTAKSMKMVFLECYAL
jgi:hypothetical protein